MVILTAKRKTFARTSGALLTEAVIGMSLLTLALIPLSFSVVQERKLAKAYYQRAVVMEILDGEMETLAAGTWRHFPEGSQRYPVGAYAVSNLPPGNFILTRDKNKVRLEWKREGLKHRGVEAREISLP